MSLEVFDAYSRIRLHILLYQGVVLHPVQRKKIWSAQIQGSPETAHANPHRKAL